MRLQNEKLINEKVFTSYMSSEMDDMERRINEMSENEKSYYFQFFKIVDIAHIMLPEFLKMCHTLVYSGYKHPKDAVILTEQVMRDADELVNKANMKLRGEYFALILGNYVNDIMVVQKYAFPEKVERYSNKGYEVMKQFLISCPEVNDVDGIFALNKVNVMESFVDKTQKRAFEEQKEVLGIDHVHPTGPGEIIPSYADVRFVYKQIKNSKKTKFLPIHDMLGNCSYFYVKDSFMDNNYEKLKEASKDYREAFVANNFPPMHKTTDKAEIKDVLEKIIFDSYKEKFSKKNNKL